MVPTWASEHGLGEANPPQRLHQNVGRRTEQQTKLIGQESMATGSIREQVQLLFLDPILHLATLTVDAFIKLPAVARHVDHEVSRVGPFLRVFSLHDHSTGSIPAPRLAGKRIEDAVGFLGLAKLSLGLPRAIDGHACQHRVARQTQDIADAVGMAPSHQSPAAQPTVGPDCDLDVGPDAAERPDQRLQDRQAVLAGVDLAGPKIGHEQFVATKDISI